LCFSARSFSFIQAEKQQKFFDQETLIYKFGLFLGVFGGRIMSFVTIFSQLSMNSPKKTRKSNEAETDGGEKSSKNISIYKI